MSVLVPARRFDPELMDSPDRRPVELRRALDDIKRVNRWLGGRRALLAALDPWLDRVAPGGTLEVLDVGTGGGDLPVAMVRHARRRGRAIAVTALDRDPVTVEVARRETAGYPEIRVVQGDVLDATFAPGSFDVVTASMFLHHFSTTRTVSLLRSFRRLARGAVVVNDLRRHRLPWLAIWVVARATGRSAMFAHDAPLSVLRGFVAEELHAFGRAAGVPEPAIVRRWPYRLVLTLPALEPTP